MSRELSKYYNINIFPLEALKSPESDLMLVIKTKPRPRFLQSAIAQKKKIIYCPIDNYQKISDVEKDRRFLAECHAILVHCERLIPVFKPYCPIVEYVEHHNRFGLSEVSDYRSEGYAVWVGSLQYLPLVVDYLQKHPLGMQIKFVVNYPLVFRGKLADALPIPDSHEVIHWTPRNQRDVMAGAKAAFDLKGQDFNQMHKAPVKAQKFIASGIPFAINAESYSAEYFLNQGFKLPTLDEREYWLSRDYWAKTQSIVEGLRTKLTLESVGLVYKHIVDRVLRMP